MSNSTLHKASLFYPMASATLLALVMHAAHANDPFTLVVLPDTQNYTEDPANRHVLSAQTQWIEDQVLVAGNPRNIQFVSHVGDIVNYGGSITQWEVAAEAFDNLEQAVKYSVLPGNHDYNVINGKNVGASNYIDHFGPNQFQEFSWFGGSDISGNSSYQFLNAGGYDFLHLAMEWRPSENVPYRSTSPIEWAQSVIDAHPNTPVILSTHEYLVDVPGTRSLYGQRLWDQFIKTNDQVFMVLGGHFQNGSGFDDGEFHQISYNDAGRPVFELLQNYQDYPNGGDGWLRLYNFDISNNRIAVETYSPLLDNFQTETIAQAGQYASQFELDIPFASRLSPIVLPRSPDYTFRGGAYSGMLDKEIRSIGGDSSLGNNAEINLKANNNSQTQALIRFKEIIGTGTNQLPPNARISSAKLSLYFNTNGSGLSVHELLTDWDESTTWGDFGNGVQTNGIDAAITPIDILGTLAGEQPLTKGTVEIDVTESIQSFLSGELQNFGWVLMVDPESDYSFGFWSSEYFQSSRRPILEITLAESADGDYNWDQNISGADFQTWQLGQSPMPYSESDLVEWEANYSSTTSAFQAAHAVSIPEPTTSVLIFVLMFSLTAQATRPLRIMQTG